MTTLNEILKSINKTKNDIWDELDDESDYKPFIINKTYSYFPDTIKLANELNIRNNIPPKFQYKFLFYILPKKYRFERWKKKKSDKKIEMIMQYYNYSYVRAKEIQDFVDMEHIKKRLETGGFSK